MTRPSRRKFPTLEVEHTRATWLMVAVVGRSRENTSVFCFFLYFSTVALMFDVAGLSEKSLTRFACPSSKEQRIITDGERVEKANGRSILWSAFANFGFWKGGETGSANLLIGAHRLIITS